MSVGLVVEIIGDAAKLSSGFDKGLGQVEGKAKGASGAIGGLNLKTAALAGVVGIAGAGLLELTKAAGDDAAEQARLEASIKASGAATGDWAAITDGAIKSAQDKAFSDTQAREALISLTTATGDATEAAALMGPAMDIARFANVDLATAADAVAKAHAGSDGALRKLLPGLEKGKTATDTLAAATAQAAGQADTYAASSAGMGEKGSQAFDELGESVGGVFLPVLQALQPLMLELAAVLQSVATFAGENQTIVLALVGAVGLLAGGILALNVALKAYKAIQLAIQAATKAWAAVQWLLNAALTANPIGLIVAAIVGLIAVIVLAYKNSETFRRIVDGAFRAVLGAARAVFDWIKANWPLLLAILLGPFGILLAVVIKNIDKIKSVVSNAIDAIKRLIKPLLDAIGSIGRAIEDLPDLPSLPSLPFLSSSTSSAGVAARGRGVSPMVSPAGPGGLIVNVYTTGDGMEAEQAVVRAVRRVARMNGGVVPGLRAGPV